MEVHPEIYHSLGVLSKNLGVTTRYLSATKFLLEIPYCTEALRWHLTFSKVGAQRVPDLIFEEEDFLPFLQSKTVISCLQSWTQGAQGLLPLVQAVVSSYADYHRRRLETLAAHDARLKFEMETLLNDSGSSADIQLLTSATRVILVVPIGTGMDCQCLAGLPSTAEDCPSAAHLQSLEQNMKLKVSWSLSASGVSDAVPVRQLLLPSQLGQLLGKVELPSWPSHGMCTLEYIPQVKRAVQRSCQEAGTALSLRRDFFKGLIAAGLGEPAEFDETTCSTASYSLKVEEEAWLVSVDLTNAFPEQKPRLTIQGGSAGECKAVDQGAWDPRWNAQEMALKIAKVVRSCV